MRSFFKHIVVTILTFIAKCILRRHNPYVIAVTGSVGKTSTKDAIYTVLKNTGSVRKSDKSFNSELGVPLSIIGAKSGWNNPLSWLGVVGKGIAQIFLSKGKYPKTLVLEVGADRPGDISTIAKWIRPHIVVITRLPEVPVHIEFFPTLDSLIEEKLSLASGLRKEGTLVLNADDPRVFAAKERFRARTVTFGMSDVADIKGSNMQFLEPGDGTPGGLAFKLDFDGKSLPVVMPNIYSEGFMTVGLAALTVAYVKEANMVTAIEDLATYETPPGRVHLIAGIKDSVLIDDTYNSSPAACESGLRMLGNIPFGKRKIAVIGDMLELGKHTIDAHKEVGRLAFSIADILVTVGLRAKTCAEAAREEGMSIKKVFEFDDAISAGEFLSKNIKSGDVLYIKGSQGVRLEKAVKILMANPSQAADLLVRQEEIWSHK